MARVISLEKVEEDVSNLSFDSPVIYQYPDLIDVPSAWIEHTPFMFWIIEALRPKVFVELGAHAGVSYCAACQVIQKLDIPTAAYAVDTWQGDEHAGFYGEDIFANLSQHHNPRYSSFSRLVRSTFDEAAEHFEDGSIDLLHIDGLHTYEAVKHDFETWKPKLSSRAVVLFHDTNVRERGFGVFQLWAELTEHYPHFEFLHGHGLGVLGVGAQTPDTLKALFKCSSDEDRTSDVRNLFGHLGRTISTACHEQHLLRLLAQKEQELVPTIEELNRVKLLMSEKEKELNRNICNLQEKELELVSRTEEVEKLRNHLEAMQNTLSWKLTKPLRVAKRYLD